MCLPVIALQLNDRFVMLLTVPDVASISGVLSVILFNTTTLLTYLKASHRQHIQKTEQKK
jgi:hypothetical protein